MVGKFAGVVAQHPSQGLSGGSGVSGLHQEGVRGHCLRSSDWSEDLQQPLPGSLQQTHAARGIRVTLQQAIRYELIGQISVERQEAGGGDDLGRAK
jgi:hypothetical protein